MFRVFLLILILLLMRKKGMTCFSASLKKDGDSTLDLWRDLLDNPKQWRDYRNPKLNGLVMIHSNAFVIRLILLLKALT